MRGSGVGARVRRREDSYLLRAMFMSDIALAGTPFSYATVLAEQPRVCWRTPGHSGIKHWYKFCFLST